MTTTSKPTAKGRRHPDVSPPRPGDDPLQRHLVAFALALVAAIVLATLTACGPGEAEDEARAAIPQAPAASQAI